MSLLDSLDTFITGTYTVTRTTNAGYDAQGRSLAGTVSTLSIDASIQPLTGKDLKVLPEGQRAESTRWLFTVTPLFVGNSAFAPDVVTYSGEDWVVVSVEEWQFLDDSFLRCRIARREIP